MQTSTTVAYIVEVRRGQGIDGSICEEGVLIYKVDSTLTNAGGIARVAQALPSGDSVRLEQCGPMYAAPFDVGSEEVATFSEGKVSIEVLEELGDNYRVRARLAA